MNFLEKMTDIQKEVLKGTIRDRKDQLAVKRSQAILMVEEGLSEDVILHITNYKWPVVVKLRRLFMKKGIESLFSKRKEKAPKALLTRNQKKQIIDMLNTSSPSDFGFNDFPFWTTSLLGYLIKEQYGVHFKSKTSFYLLFKEARFSFRKPEKRSERRDEKQIAEWKEKYEPIIKEECAQKDTVVLVGDEMVLVSQTRVQRVWLPKDAPAFVQDTAKRESTHFYGFLDVQSGVSKVFQTRSQTGEVTVSILKKLRDIYPHKRIVLFWDNASWHKSETVREYLKSTECFKLYNFPTYAPDLNPQEHVWKEIREKVLNNKLIKSIDKAAQQVIEFVDNSLFKYKFFGLHGTFKM